jgi:hypothetical protein
MTVLRYYCPGDETIVLLREKKTATTPMLQPKENKSIKEFSWLFME